MTSFVLATLLWLPSLAQFHDAGRASQDGANRREDARHSFRYHEYLLLRHNGSVVAIYAIPNPRYGKSGITYQWFRIPEGADAFAKGPDWEDENPVVTFGTGSTYDGITCRNTYPAYFFGSIETDSLTIKWMSHDKESGVLHFSHENGPKSTFIRCNLNGWTTRWIRLIPNNGGPWPLIRSRSILNRFR